MAKELEEQLTLPNIDIESDRVKNHEKVHKSKIKKIIEAILFASHEPIHFQRLREIIETKLSIKPKVIRDALEGLQEDYVEQNRAFRLEETAEGYILKTREEYSGYIEQLFQGKRKDKLSQAAIEVIAIIAYKQPISKAQVDAIRGVDCSGILQNLLDRELIQSAGKLEAPGRPTLYATTSHFLTHFGLKNIDELPGV